MDIRAQIFKVKQTINSCKISLANLAAQLRLSKDSVKRRVNVIKSRSHHPCADLFETPAGHQWLTLIIVAAIVLFGIKSNVGSATLAKFFSIIGVHLFIGLSKTSLDNIENKIDEMIAKFGGIHDAKLNEIAKDIDLLAGADETFFKDLQVLLFVDLPSGFIFREEISKNRTFSTWDKLTNSIVGQFKSIKCLVSDKGKALVKLAKDGVKCISSADLFHVINHVKSLMQFQFSAKIKSCQCSIIGLEKELETATSEKLKTTAIENKITSFQAQLDQHHHNQHIYQQQLQNISAAVHPFDANTTLIKNSNTVSGELNNYAKTLRQIEKTSNIDDKYKQLKSFENEIGRASVQIDSWWKWVNLSTSSFNLDESTLDWLLNKLLPVIYWQQQQKKTRSQNMQDIYKKSIRVSQSKLLAHPLTATIDSDLYKEYESWAKLMSSYFQRTTSAVEGRNGILSQYVHSSRSLSKKRLRSLTVINNYYNERDDGRTALERISKLKPDCLIKYIMENISELSLPRKHKAGNDKTLYLQGVAA